MGDEPIIIEQFFYGFEGVIMGSIMGSQNIMGPDYGSNISAGTTVNDFSVPAARAPFLPISYSTLAYVFIIQSWLRGLNHLSIQHFIRRVPF